MNVWVSYLLLECCGEDVTDLVEECLYSLDRLVLLQRLIQVIQDHLAHLTLLIPQPQTSHWSQEDSLSVKTAHKWFSKQMNKYLGILCKQSDSWVTTKTVFCWRKKIPPTLTRDGKKPDGVYISFLLFAWAQV